jgi:pimeloyl-ACP methyl ester carboxylesterase
MKLLSFLFWGLATIVSLLGLYTALGVYFAERDYPPLGRLLTLAPEAGIGAKNGTADAGKALRLHYVERGEGPREIVLLHGGSSSLREFTAQILPCLGANYRTLAIDRPGYGYSDRPAGDWSDPLAQARLLHAALRQLKVERPILVGYSWAGALALAYLLEYPEEASGAVLLAGVTHPWEGGVYTLYRLAGVPVLGQALARTLVFPIGRFYLQRIAARVFAPNPVPPRLLAETAAVLSLRPGAFLANAEDTRPLSDFLARQQSHYAELARPVLAISGEEDAVVPWRHHAGRLITESAKVELVLMKGIGHGLHHLQPARICELIGGFAAKHAAKHAGPASTVLPSRTAPSQPGEEAMPEKPPTELERRAPRR